MNVSHSKHGRVSTASLYESHPAHEMQRLRSAVKLVSSALASPQTVQWRCCFLPHNITPCNASLNLAKYVVLKIMLPPCLSMPLLKQIRGQKNEAHYINFHLLWCWCTQVLSKGKEGFPTSFPFMQSTGNYDKAKGLEALLWPQKEKKKQFTDAWHYMYAATWKKKETLMKNEGLFDIDGRALLLITSPRA